MAVNKVILLGNVGQDPEVRSFDNGDKVANFSLATTERGFTTSDGKTIPEITEWHNCSATRGLAKVVESYVKKGDKLYIEGKMVTRSYEDKGGVKRYITEVRVQNLEMLSSKNNTQQQTNSNQYQNNTHQSNSTQVNDGLPF